MVKTLVALTPSVQVMKPYERYMNLAAVVLPFFAFLAAIVLLWNRAVGVRDLAILGVLYLIGGFGVTIGFHRLLTHRAFQTHKSVEYLFASLGSLTIQGPVIHWVADHRKHHAHTDRRATRTRPHAGHDGGLRGALHGLFHAHVGWLCEHPRPGGAPQVRARPRRGPRHARDQPRLPALRARLARHSGAAGLPARRHARRRALRRCCGAASCGSSCSTT